MATHWSSRRSLTALLMMGSAIIAAGCAPQEEDEGESTSESAVEVAPTLVVAETDVAMAAETLPDSIRIPVAVGERHSAMAPGTLFASGRGSSNGKNPEGFLRRVESVRTEGGVIVIMTKPATLTDAIVNGTVRTTGSGNSIDGNEVRSTRESKGLDLDFGNEMLFENVDEIPSAEGSTVFKESIKLTQAHLFAKPNVSIDLDITKGKVSRFLAKVEGNVDTAIFARADVTADGPVSKEVIAALAAKEHEVSRVVYKSARLPLPTFSAGRVPVSPSVVFTVTMKCKLVFGGPIVAKAGVEAKSYIRLAALQQNGVWSPPVQSDFDIRPSFVIKEGSGSEINAHCALEMDAELGAYGEPGLIMNVSPFVDFGVREKITPAMDTPQHFARALHWSASAGATGAMHGRADVFGVPEIDLPLAAWSAGELLTGVVKPKEE